MQDQPPLKRQNVFAQRELCAMPRWADLNERQQQYMQAVYETDQEQEAEECGMWKRGGTSASLRMAMDGVRCIRWRWLHALHETVPAQVDR